MTLKATQRYFGSDVDYIKVDCWSVNFLTRNVALEAIVPKVQTNTHRTFVTLLRTNVAKQSCSETF